MSQSITLSADQLQAIVAKAVADTLARVTAPATTPKAAKVTRRAVKSGDASQAVVTSVLATLSAPRGQRQTHTVPELGVFKNLPEDVVKEIQQYNSDLSAAWSAGTQAGKAKFVELLKNNPNRSMNSVQLTEMLRTYAPHIYDLTYVNVNKGKWRFLDAKVKLGSEERQFIEWLGFESTGKGHNRYVHKVDETKAGGRDRSHRMTRQDLTKLADLEQAA